MNGKQCSPSVRAGWLAVAALFALLSAGGAGRAAVRYVNKNAAGPAHEGTSWSTAFTTVGTGMGTAYSGDEVWVARGTYLEITTVRAGVSLYGGFAGTETSRTQRDWKANPTILDGAGGTGDVVTCLDNTVVDGITIRYGGRGVYVPGTATVRLSHNTISGNVGDGVSVHDGATATLTNNTISFNGGYGLYLQLTATATISSNTISVNGFNGVRVDDGSATLSNNTISGNSRNGVWVHYDAVATLSNNILAFNGAYGLAADGRILDFSHNDVYGNTAGEYTNYTPPAGQANVSVDPLFVDQVSSDYHLAAGSPCIDTGDDSVVTPGETDLDGKPRIIGPHVDMGAYEYGALTPPFTLTDVTKCLSIASGLTSGSADVARLEVEPPPVTGSQLDIRDAIRLARKVAGLEANP